MRSARKSILLALPFVAACAGSSKPGTEATSKQEKAREESAAPLPDLKAIIDVRAVKSVDALLPLLDADVLGHPVLLHESGSKHVASFAAPRVILHSSDGRLALAFNSGVSGQTGDQSLEVMRFDDQSSRFVFSEIKFPLDQVGAPIFSEDDPERCLGCHDSPGRPNWASYPSWPGAYGEKGDAVTPGSEEAKGLQTFLASFRDHPRYKFLENLETRYAVEQDGKIKAKPNVSLLGLYARLNARRIAAEVKAQPAYESQRDEILKLFGGCGATSDLAAGAAKLGLQADLNDWTLNFLGSDDTSRREPTVPPFQDESGDYLKREFFPAMQALDPALAGRDGPCS